MNDLDEIRNKLSSLNLLYKMFVFKCFDSDIFTFVREDDSLDYNEINFIAKDNTLTWDMKGIELLNLKNIQFFNFRIFCNGSKITYDKSFNIHNQSK